MRTQSILLVREAISFLNSDSADCKPDLIYHLVSQLISTIFRCWADERSTKIMLPVGPYPGWILQYPDGEPPTIYRGQGQKRCRDDLDLLRYVSGTSGRIVPPHQSDGADIEKFDGLPMRPGIRQTRKPLP